MEGNKRSFCGVSYEEAVSRARRWGTINSGNTVTPEVGIGEFFLALIGFALTLLNFVLLIYVLNAKFEQRYSTAKSRFGALATVFLMLLALVVLATLPSKFNWMLFLVDGLILYAYVIIFRKGPVHLKFFWLFILLVFFAIIQTAGTAFSIAVFDTVDAGALSMGKQALVSVFTTLMLVLTSFILVRKGKKAVEVPPMVAFVLVLVPLLSCVVLLFWSDSIFPVSDADSTFAVFQIFAALALALINYAVFLLYDYMADESEKSLKQQAIIQKAELSTIHYGELQALYRGTREWRHDYQNHLTVVSGLLATKNYPRLEDYVEELKGSAKKMSFRVSSGNEAIDAILNTKISRAEAEGIAFEAVVAADLSALPLTSVELASLFGNLIDNAIEACERIDDENQPRMISLKVTNVGTQVLIHLKNAAKPDAVVKKEGRFVTSKKQGDHGIGMSRIDEIIESHNGTIERKQEENTFETFIMLPQESNCSK